jgi:hypothetical protein
MQVALRPLSRFIALSRIANALAFTFLPAGVVANDKIVVFPSDRFAWFATLQSRVHEIWTRFFGTTLKDDLCYTRNLCFDTFPFPVDCESCPTLEEAGRNYYEHRGQIMRQHNEGLTKTFNRFHNPEEESPEIAKLRDLHAGMDHAVLDAYGWSDIQPRCEFVPEFDEEDEDEDESGLPWRKKYRYRWPDEIRDEVLARLLELNRQRALEEGQVLVAAESGGGVSNKRKQSKKTAPAAAGAVLIGSDPES